MTDLNSILYDDLDNCDLGQQVEDLKLENFKLNDCIKELQDNVENLYKTIDDLKKNNLNLTENISSLYKTAKAEIARKDRTIAELREELDKLAQLQLVNNRGKFGKQFRDKGTNETRKRTYENDDLRNRIDWKKRKVDKQELTTIELSDDDVCERSSVKRTVLNLDDYRTRRIQSNSMKSNDLNTQITSSTNNKYKEHKISSQSEEKLALNNKKSTFENSVEHNHTIRRNNEEKLNNIDGKISKNDLKNYSTIKNAKSDDKLKCKRENKRFEINLNERKKSEVDDGKRKHFNVVKIKILSPKKRKSSDKSKKNDKLNSSNEKPGEKLSRITLYDFNKDLSSPKEDLPTIEIKEEKSTDYIIDSEKGDNVEMSIDKENPPTSEVLSVIKEKSLPKSDDKIENKTLSDHKNEIKSLDKKNLQENVHLNSSKEEKLTKIINKEEKRRSNDNKTETMTLESSKKSLHKKSLEANEVSNTCKVKKVPKTDDKSEKRKSTDYITETDKRKYSEKKSLETEETLKESELPKIDNKEETKNEVFTSHKGNDLQETNKKEKSYKMEKHELETRKKSLDKNNSQGKEVTNSYKEKKSPKIDHKQENRKSTDNKIEKRQTKEKELPKSDHKEEKQKSTNYKIEKEKIETVKQALGKNGSEVNNSNIEKKSPEVRNNKERRKSGDHKTENLKNIDNKKRFDNKRSHSNIIQEKEALKITKLENKDSKKEKPKIDDVKKSLNEKNMDKKQVSQSETLSHNTNTQNHSKILIKPPNIRKSPKETSIEKSIKENMLSLKKKELKIVEDNLENKISKQSSNSEPIEKKKEKNCTPNVRRSPRKRNIRNYDENKQLQDDERDSNSTVEVQKSPTENVCLDVAPSHENNDQQILNNCETEVVVETSGANSPLKLRKTTLDKNVVCENADQCSFDNSPLNETVFLTHDGDIPVLHLPDVTICDTNPNSNLIKLIDNLNMNEIEYNLTSKVGNTTFPTPSISTPKRKRPRCVMSFKK